MICSNSEIVAEEKKMNRPLSCSEYLWNFVQSGLSLTKLYPTLYFMLHRVETLALFSNQRKTCVGVFISS